jgi:hypothetical protein
MIVSKRLGQNLTFLKPLEYIELEILFSEDYKTFKTYYF